MAMRGSARHHRQKRWKWPVTPSPAPFAYRNQRAGRKNAVPLGRRVLASVLAVDGAPVRAATASAPAISAGKPEPAIPPVAIRKADVLLMPPAAVRARRIATTKNAAMMPAAANAGLVPAIWCAVIGNAMTVTGFAPIRKQPAAGWEPALNVATVTAAIVRRRWNVMQILVVHIAVILIV